MTKEQPKSLRFPREGYSDSLDGYQLGSYHTAASLNVLGSLPYSPRFSGGTRPGCAPVSTATFASPQAVFVIPWKTESGVLKETLAVVSGGMLYVVDGADAISTEGYAGTDALDFIVTDDGRKIIFTDASGSVVGEGSSVGVVFNGSLYYMSGSVVTRYEPRTGLTETVVSDVFGATRVGVYRGRLALYGGDNVIHFSAVLNPGDFDMGAHWEKSTKANALSLTRVGERGDVVTAFMPFDDNLAYIATRNALWRLDGDPIGGRLTRISQEVGVVQHAAWARGDGAILFLSEDGLYMVDGQGQLASVPSADNNGIRHRIYALERPDTTSKDWQIGYDRTLGGFVIAAVSSGMLADAAWVVDDRRAVWPLAFAASRSPRAFARTTSEGVSELLMLGKDGKVRHFTRTSATDDADGVFSSAVTIGPVFHSVAGVEDALLAEMLVELDSVGTAATGAKVSVFAGKTAQAVLARASSFTEWVSTQSGTAPHEDAQFSFRGGWNNVVRPRVRGNVFALVLWSTNGRWCFSNMTTVSRGLGRVR